MKSSKLSFKMAKACSSAAGFTLVELTLAISISTIVIAVAGWGLVTIMRANAKAENETQRRIELNRAINYIVEDIRMSQSISDASNYTINQTSPSCATATPVLELTIPDGDSTNTVVYYLNDISQCSNSETVWLEPAVIKRVEVDDVNDTTIEGNRGSELVDAISISNTDIPTDSDFCLADSETLTPSNNQQGFYACIRSGRIAQIYLRGKLSDFSDPYLVNSSAFARSSSN